MHHAPGRDVCVHAHSRSRRCRSCFAAWTAFSVLEAFVVLVALTRSCFFFFFFFFFLACNALEFCNKSMRHLKGMPPRKLCTFLRGNVDSAAGVDEDLEPNS